MPMIELPEKELQALQAVFATAKEVDWDAYDRAKRRILNLPPVPTSPTTEVTTHAQ